MKRETIDRNNLEIGSPDISRADWNVTPHGGAPRRREARQVWTPANRFAQYKTFPRTFQGSEHNYVSWTIPISTDEETQRPVDSYSPEYTGQQPETKAAVVSRINRGGNIDEPVVNRGFSTSTGLHRSSCVRAREKAFIIVVMSSLHN